MGKCCGLSILLKEGIDGSKTNSFIREKRSENFPKRVLVLVL